MVADAPSEFETVSPSRPVDMAGRASILLVEDSEDDVILGLRALRKSDVDLEEVAVVRDGSEALDYLFAQGCYSRRNPAEVPKLILLDLKLPKLSGLEVLRALRSDPRTFFVPTVMLTSSAAESDLATSYSYGVNSYVQKPVDTREFDLAIQRITRYWLDLNRTPGD